MKAKAIPAPPSGRGGVQVGLGRTGGPSFSSYQRVPGGVNSGSRQFALGASLAQANGDDRSIPVLRPTQQQQRDNPGQYQTPRPDFINPTAGTTPAGRETTMGRPGGPRAVGPPALPMAGSPDAGTLETGHEGPAPYGGREPMMTPTAAPAMTVMAPPPPLPSGGLAVGHDGPVARAGNFPGAFEAHGDQTPPVAQEGTRMRNAVRALARSNGGVPADLEAPTARGRSGGLMTSMESRMAGAGSVALNPPGPSRGGGMESHQGPADGSGPGR